MILEQFYLGCLAHASYIVADQTTRAAVVVDPQRDIERYLAFARDRSFHIGHVVLTHFHADFVAGHLELRNRTGALIYLGAKARAEYAFTPLADGDTIELGAVRLQAVETPGHTVESISLLAFDLEVSAVVPGAVLTGDTLFVGDVGRPDLRVALGWSATDLGSMLYDSLHRKLLPLPDATLVYPAHGAGSLCGKAISKEKVSTIGEQRQSNYALQPMTRDAFVSLVTTDQPDAPPYFTFDAILNTKEHETLETTLARTLTPLPLDRVLGLEREGAQLLDTRDPGEFAASHLRHSINIGLGGQFASWAGTILTRDRPIVIIADPGREHEAALRLGRVGFDGVAGYLAEGLLGLEGLPELTGSTERVSAPLAAERMASALPPVILDVRAPEERRKKRIEGSLGIPLNQLRDRLAEVPREGAVLVHCAGGYRSSIAASLLKAGGFEAVGEIAGGITAWETAGLKLLEP
jgi:glyoxylase-like metal-dependent hydrolase (beta-lactamase superfamily II)/rhodanese-related sulfurtransferase